MTTDRAIDLLENGGHVDGNDEFMEAYWMAVNALKSPIKDRSEIIDAMKSNWRLFHKTGNDKYMDKAQSLCWVLQLDNAEIEKIFLEIQKED